MYLWKGWQVDHPILIPKRWIPGSRDYKVTFPKHLLLCNFVCKVTHNISEMGWMENFWRWKPCQSWFCLVNLMHGVCHKGGITCFCESYGFGARTAIYHSKNAWQLVGIGIKLHQLIALVMNPQRWAIVYTSICKRPQDVWQLSKLYTHVSQPW